MTTPVSVVIPCKNAERWIGEQLDALARQDYPGPIEIIVADNGSDDASRQIAASHPGVQVIDASARRGPNYGRNLGANRATGEVILTCDADDVVDSHWVTAMVAALAEHDLVAGRLDYEALNPGEGARVERRLEKDSRLGFLPAAATCNFGIRTSVLRSLGGWDETMDYGFEDAELSWRAQLAGYRFGRAENAVVRYRLRATTGEVAKQAYRGAQGLPVMARRFRSQGMSLRPLVWKALRFAGYLVLAAPLTPFNRRIRTEWLRKAAIAAGVVRGMFRRRRV